MDAKNKPSGTTPLLAAESSGDEPESHDADGTRPAANDGGPIESLTDDNVQEEAVMAALETLLNDRDRRQRKITTVFLAIQATVLLLTFSFTGAGLAVFGGVMAWHMKTGGVFAFCVLQTMYSVVVVSIMFGISESGVVCKVIKNEKVCVPLALALRYVTVVDAAFAMFGVAAGYRYYRYLKREHPRKRIRVSLASPGNPDDLQSETEA